MVYNRALSSAERRTLVSYLRRKYDLDVLDALMPAGTQLLQAEDFDGPWQLNSRWDQFATLPCVSADGMSLPEARITRKESSEPFLSRSQEATRSGCGPSARAPIAACAQAWAANRWA